MYVRVRAADVRPHGLENRRRLTATASSTRSRSDFGCRSCFVTVRPRSRQEPSSLGYLREIDMQRMPSPIGHDHAQRWHKP